MENYKVKLSGGPKDGEEFMYNTKPGTLILICYPNKPCTLIYSFKEIVSESNESVWIYRFSRKEMR